MHYTNYLVRAGSRLERRLAACSAVELADHNTMWQQLYAAIRAAGRSDWLTDSQLWNFVTKLFMDGDCLVWHGSRNLARNSRDREPRSYGVYTVNSAGGKRTYRVHNLLLTLLAGPAPGPEFVACHGDCHNTFCVRHVSWGTHSSNALDKHRDGTFNSMRPTVAWFVHNALARGTESPQAIAARLNISDATVRQIRRGANFNTIVPGPAGLIEARRLMGLPTSWE